MQLSRVLFVRVTATANTTTTGTATCPISGTIRDIEISIPTHTVGELEYALLRNSEALYPGNGGYATRPTSGDDNINLNSKTHIKEGDLINLIVRNTNANTNYDITVKVTIDGHAETVW